MSKLLLEISRVPRDLWKNIIGLVAVIIVLVVVLQYFDIETLRAQIESAGAIAPILFIIAKASTIVIAPLGGSPLYPIAGALFGFWKGSALLIAGDMLGGVIAFILSRVFGRPLVEWMIGNDRGLLTKALALMGEPRGYVIARFSFISMPELASYGAGLTKLGFFPFVVIYTAIGAIPSVILAGIGHLLSDSQNSFFIPIITAITAITSVVAAGLFLWFLHRSDEIGDSASAKPGNLHNSDI